MGWKVLRRTYLELSFWNTSWYFLPRRLLNLNETP